MASSDAGKGTTGTGSQDLATKLTSRLVAAVDATAGKVLSPLGFIARLVVYGLVATVVGSAALLIFLDLLVRICSDYIFGHLIWLFYLILGVVFCTAGLVIWSKRPPLAHQES